MDHTGGKRERLEIIDLIRQVPPVENLPEFDHGWIEKSPRIPVIPVMRRWLL
jgi:hypothetical protein